MVVVPFPFGKSSRPQWVFGDAAAALRVPAPQNQVCSPGNYALAVDCESKPARKRRGPRQFPKLLRAGDVPDVRVAIQRGGRDSATIAGDGRVCDSFMRKGRSQFARGKVPNGNLVALGMPDSP